MTLLEGYLTGVMVTAMLMVLMLHAARRDVDLKAIDWFDVVGVVLCSWLGLGYIFGNILNE